MALLASVAALFVIGQTDFGRRAVLPPAHGQTRSKTFHPARYQGPQDQSHRPRSKKDVPIRQPFGENMPKGPLQMVVSIDEQHAMLYSNGVRVARDEGLDRHSQPSDADRRVQHHPEEPLAPFESLRQCADVLHAPPDLVGHCAARRAPARLSRPRTAASACRPISCRGSGTSASWACGWWSRPQLAPQEFAHAKLFNPAPKPVDTQRTSEAPLAPEGLRSSLATTGQGPVRLAQAETVATDPASHPAHRASPPRAGRSRQVQPSRRGRHRAEASAIPATLRRDRRRDDGRAGTDRRGRRAGPNCRARHDHRVDHAGVPAAPVSEPVTTSTVATPAAAPAPSPAAATSEPERPAVNPNEPKPAGAAAHPRRRAGEAERSGRGLRQRQGEADLRPPCLRAGVRHADRDRQPGQAARHPRLHRARSRGRRAHALERGHHADDRRAARRRDGGQEGRCQARAAASTKNVAARSSPATPRTPPRRSIA